MYLHAPTSAGCVSKDWAQAVKNMRLLLRKEFIVGRFDVHCFRSSRHTDVIEKLQPETYQLHGDDFDMCAWWLKTQFNLRL